MKINLLALRTLTVATVAAFAHLLHTFASDLRPNGFCGTGLTALPSRVQPRIFKLSTPPSADTQAEPVVLDLIALYTPQAAAAARTEQDLRESISHNVYEANNSFAASGVNVRLNLLYCNEINYAESGRLLTDAARLVNGESGLSRAHTLRNDFKADIVCLFIEQDTIGIGGQAADVPTIQGNEGGAFMVLRRCMLNYSLVFAHETGHLLGCNHSRQDLPGLNPNDPWVKARFPYFFGSRWTVEGVPYADIMSYPPGIHYHMFGNPEILMDGVPTGAGESTPHPSNAAKTINQIAPVVALYRSAASRIEFDSPTAAVWETNQAITLQLRRTGDLSTATRVTVTFDSSSSARSGEDYIRPGVVTVPFVAQQDRAEFTIPLLNDDAVEGDESIVLNLSAPVGPNGIGLNSSVVIATSDDEFPYIFPRQKITASESSRLVSIPILFHGVSNATENSVTTMQWHTEDGTALAGSDYEAASGTLTFHTEGEQRFVPVKLLDDAAPEPDESFFVVLNGLRQEIRIADNDRMGAVLSIAPFDMNTSSELEDRTGFNVLARGDGKMLAWGSFAALGSATSNSVSGSRICLIDEMGQVDQTFKPPRILAGHRELPGRTDPPIIYTALPLSDGRILIGGQFSRVGGEPRLNLACLTADGALASDFDSQLSFDGPIYSLMQQTDGKVLVAGFFRSVNDAPQACLVRILPNGKLDPEFHDPNIHDSQEKAYVNTAVVQPDGKIIAGGSFNSAGGVISSNLARFNPDGTRDSKFKIGNGASEQIDALALQRDGRILVAGHFQTFNGRSSRRIVRLNSDGSIDTSFRSPNPNGEICHLLLLPDERILLSGKFTAFGNTPRRFLALLKNDGSPDTTCDFGTGPDNMPGNDLVIAFGEQASGQPFTFAADGSLLIAGNFGAFNDLPCGPVVKIRFGPLAPYLSIAAGTSGNLSLRAAGLPGSQYDLESSDDLSSWRSAGSIILRDYKNTGEMSAPDGRRFQAFRLKNK